MELRDIISRERLLASVNAKLVSKRKYLATRSIEMGSFDLVDTSTNTVEAMIWDLGVFADSLGVAVER